MPLGVKRALSIAARAALGGVFVFAAVPKILAPDAFAEAIANYHLFPSSVIGAIAVTVPVMELVVALALLSGVWARGAALTACFMLAAFAGAMAQALVRDINLDCGCFGAGASVDVSWTTVARNGVLALLAVPILAIRDSAWPLRDKPATAPADAVAERRATWR